MNLSFISASFTATYRFVNPQKACLKCNITMLLIHIIEVYFNVFIFFRFIAHPDNRSPENRGKVNRGSSVHHLHLKIAIIKILIILLSLVSHSDNN